MRSQLVSIQFAKCRCSMYKDSLADFSMHLDVDVNFDLCMNDNAASTLFGSSGTGFLNGTANEVPCSEWVGSADITS